jgi:16S rRNA (adenine1518-N6/adenine1519-N6)-dimethyltransferase
MKSDVQGEMISEDRTNLLNFSPINARKLLQKHKIRPNRRLGQNFLVDPKALSSVVTAAELTGNETVLEIGAGLGALTCRLAQAARQVVTVEVDQRFIPLLEEVISHYQNVRLVYGDILELNLTTIVEDGEYTVIANIPYSITSALIRRLMEAEKPAERIVLTVQREVAERIIAKPGSLNLLAVSVQIYGEPRIVVRIPAKAFYPKPKVDSAVLRVDVHCEPIVDQVLLPTLFHLARAGFGQKRKQLRNALAGGLRVSPSVVMEWLEKAAIQPMSRAQELGLDAWVLLTQVVMDEGGLAKLIHDK